jgi:hypothetical protein
MTQIELSITKITLVLAPNSSIIKQATPTAFDPCRQRCPDNADNHCRNLRHPAIVTDQLAPSKLAISNI